MFSRPRCGPSVLPLERCSLTTFIGAPLSQFLSEEGVGSVTDLLVPKSSTKPGKTYLPWLVRRVEVIRGKLNFRVECMPGFNYCRDKHTTEVRCAP